MKPPQEINLGQGPDVRVALMSSKQVICDVARAIRSHPDWKQHRVEHNVWYVPMPGCSEKVVVHFWFSRPAEQWRCNIGVCVRQFDRYSFIRRGAPPHPLSPGVILHLLMMIREAIGPAAESCSALLEDEIDQVEPNTLPGTILVYDSVAPILSDRYTLMDYRLAQLRWADLRKPPG